jgi:single-stranded-DNA-specific exonuclease
MLNDLSGCSPVESARVSEGSRLTEAALEVLRHRFPGAENPLLEWLPPKPCWRSGLKDLDLLREELARVRHTPGCKIVLYGHDDMDGITGLFTGLRVLRGEGYMVLPIIPNRATENYGLIPERMEGLLMPGDLLLTVDSGCSAVEGIDWALAHGARVVVTDHHTLNPPLPRPHALIDPQVTGFPGTVLSGCGVLYAALAEIFPDWEDDPQLIAAVALGTISDRVPLLAWNRYLLNRFRSIDLSRLTEGLRHMLEVWPCRTGNWSAATVRQQITSVVGKGHNSGINRILDFMFCDRREPCLEEWNDMLEWSESRAQLLSELLTRAMQAKDPQADAFGMILVYLDGIPPGMGGTLASKLSRIYRRGSIVITSRSDNTLVGEARSVGDWDMAHFLVSLRKVFASAGGHIRAAGFSAAGMSWPQLRDLLISHMAGFPTQLVPEPHIDLERKILPRASELACLAPFGPDFPPPAVRVGNMRYLLQLNNNGANWCISEESGE